MTPDEIRTNHFARLNGYRDSREYAAFAQTVGLDAAAGEQSSLFGQRWEIDEAIYDEFLNMLPPLHWRGGSFFMSEGTFEDIHAKFSREGERYFCEFARLPRPAVPGPVPAP